jgi:zinc and cadmium transporter
MSPYWLAAVYSLMILLAALAGGWVPMVVRLTHTRMQVALSFVAGVILGIGLLHLVPHGFDDVLLGAIFSLPSA